MGIFKRIKVAAAKIKKANMGMNFVYYGVLPTPEEVSKEGLEEAKKEAEAKILNMNLYASAEVDAWAEQWKDFLGDGHTASLGLGMLEGALESSMERSVITVLPSIIWKRSKGRAGEQVAEDEEIVN